MKKKVHLFISSIFLFLTFLFDNYLAFLMALLRYNSPTLSVSVNGVQSISLVLNFVTKYTMVVE